MRQCKLEINRGAITSLTYQRHCIGKYSAVGPLYCAAVCLLVILTELTNDRPLMSQSGLLIGQDLSGLGLGCSQGQARGHGREGAHY